MGFTNLQTRGGRGSLACRRGCGCRDRRLLQCTNRRDALCTRSDPRLICATSYVFHRHCVGCFSRDDGVDSRRGTGPSGGHLHDEQCLGALSLRGPGDCHRRRRILLPTASRLAREGRTPQRPIVVVDAARWLRSRGRSAHFHRATAVRDRPGLHQPTLVGRACR